MRIGLFTDTYSPQINGVVTVVQIMARQFEELGHEAVVFAPAYPNQPPEDAHKVWRFPSRKVRFHPESRLTWPYRRQLRGELERLDIIHSHTPFSLGLLAVWAARHYRLPHVHTYHTYFAEYRHYIPRPIRPTRRMAERISRAFCNRCDLVLAPSEEMKAHLLEYGVCTPVEAMPFGIDLEAFQRPARFRLREALSLSPGTKLLLTAGRLGPEKNFQFVLEAFARIQRGHGNLALVVAGDGPARAALQERTQALGVAAWVHFLGYLERAQLIDAYHQADLFVFASKTETQGIVLLEAQAAGSPVVAIGEMGVRDVVAHGDSGLLVPDDVAAFSQAVLDLLLDEPRRRRMSAGARRLAQEHSAQKTCRDLLDLYSQLRPTGTLLTAA
ncbi:MAG TPA: glycosyltransferase family 4 protein [Candidatus Bipolaricaulota bacterium]